MTEQLNLFGVRECDCGRTATVIQETIFGEEHYCQTCYNRMTEEKEREETA